MSNVNETRFFGMLGFAMRAGRLIIGTESVCRALAQRTAKLVLVSSDASRGTRDKITHKCEFYKTPCTAVPFTAEALGRALGKTYLPMGIACTDEGFSAELQKALGRDLPNT